jgi:hypothetical protein
MDTRLERAINALLLYPLDTYLSFISRPFDNLHLFDYSTEFLGAETPRVRKLAEIRVVSCPSSLVSLGIRLPGTRTNQYEEGQTYRPLAGDSIKNDRIRHAF